MKNGVAVMQEKVSNMKALNSRMSSKNCITIFISY